MEKYKPVMKKIKEGYSEVYRQVALPTLSKKDNMYATINIMSKTAMIETIKTKETNKGLYKMICITNLMSDLEGNFLHYFIKNDSLVNFLKTTEVRDTSIVDEYIHDNKIELSENVGFYSVAIHTKNEGLVITYLRDEERTDKTQIIITDEKDIIDFVVGEDTKHNELCNLAINFIYYIKAYPNKIEDGLPDDMVKNDRKKMTGKCSVIGIADEIVEKTDYVNGREVSPHFRSGFFRHYTADRYINMKGKVQFIAATVVKGRAKTVVA